MASTIVTKNSSTASAVPVSGDLTQGELAVNVTDKRLFTKNSGGTVVELGTNPASLALPNGTANGVAYLNGSKVVTTGSALTFDGTNLGIGTSSPASKLHVESTTGNQLRIAYNSSFYWKIERDPSTGALKFSDVSTERLNLDQSGNLGLGVTPSAWSSAKAIDVTSWASFGQDSNGYSVVTGNAFYNGTNWVRKQTASAAMYAVDGPSGTHKWSIAGSSTAGSTISFTQAMTLTAAGELAVGTTAALLSGSGRGNITVNGSTDSILALGVAGSWGAYLTANSSNVELASQGSRYMSFSTNGSERARIDSSGNLGIGTTSQNERLRVNSSTAGQARLTVAYADSVISYFGSYSGIVGSGNATDVMLSSANVLAFGSGGTTERARIDSSGRLLVGQTSYSTTTDGVALQASGSVFARSGTGAATNINIANGNGVVGTITTSGTSTAYNTSSDYRLKESIAPMTGALAKVAALKPVTYKWKSDGSDGEGFIAHELAEVVPQCVTGEKDAVDAEGNPQYQGIDTSFLVATLTAALQEAVAEINSLKARLDAANL